MTGSIQFCDCCGAKVTLLAALDVPTEETDIFGKQHEKRNTYSRPQRKLRRLRPNLSETGEKCPGCQQLVVCECSHCPRCGRMQRWTRAEKSQHGAIRPACLSRNFATTAHLRLHALFCGSGDRPKNIPPMSREGHFQYLEGDGFQAVKPPSGEERVNWPWTGPSFSSSRTTRRACCCSEVRLWIHGRN